MAKLKFDGVVEAVRYSSAGQVDWVRAYERRGAAFSDHVLINREDLIARLKAGKRFLTGKRIAYLGGSFETAKPLLLSARDGRETIHTEGSVAEGDHLDGVPLI